MKKISAVLLGLCALCALAAGCAAKPAPAPSDIVDLTAMSSTLVYAEVYNITNNPAQYVGKTIKMRGTYQANYYEPTAQYYHSVVIADAAACCAQGLEFEWAGKHAFPGDYPANGAEVEVTGVFTPYQELGQTYYHLTVDGIDVVG